MGGTGGRTWAPEARPLGTDLGQRGPGAGCSALPGGGRQGCRQLLLSSFCLTKPRCPDSCGLVLVEGLSTAPSACCGAAVCVRSRQGQGRDGTRLGMWARATRGCSQGDDVVVLPYCHPRQDVVGCTGGCGDSWGALWGPGTSASSGSRTWPRHIPLLGSVCLGSLFWLTAKPGQSFLSSSKCGCAFPHLRGFRH